MNKNRFRIIFNAVRGVMMVVAEFVKSHTASADSTDSSPVNDSQSQINPSDSPEDDEATIRPFVFSIMLALGLVCVVVYIAPARADIIADQTAPANQRPVVINAPNGVPLVNIQTPSAAGVSRNVYSQFDVNNQGAILNNSRNNVQTQLGGFVQGNPYLATGTARIILNEVNASNPSLLNGYVEVAGSRAQVVIANPAGISCNGCGFINASRATLTTGTPMINNGDLMGYRVGGGVVNFLGRGLDSASSNYTDVIARAVNVNAGLWAQDLNIITGSNQVNVASNGDVTGITSISPNATLPDGSSNPTPAFAVDVAALGGMYAGKIHMIGTEAGVGVRNAGSIGASIGEVAIDVNGMLTNTYTGHLSSAGGAQMTTTGDVNNQGAIYAQGNITLTSETLNNQGGYIGAKGAITANSIAINNNTGAVASESVIALNGTSLDNQAGSIEANDNINLNITNNINNQNGLFRSGQTLTLTAANVDNRNTQGVDANSVPTQGIEANYVNISADQIDSASGTMRADNALAITGSGTLSNSQGTLSSTGTLSIADRLANANSNVAGKTLAITNTGGTIIAGTDLTIDSNSLTGDGEVLSQGNLTTKLVSNYTHTGEWQANGNASFETTSTLTNQSKLLAGNILSLTAGTLDNQTSGEIAGTTLQLNATDTHTLTNRGLIDGSDTFIDTVTLNNIGTGRIYGDHVAIATTTLTNDAETVNGVTSAAVIAARDRLDIGATTITNQNEALIFSAGDMAIGGSLDGNHQTTGTVGSINNVSASIEALGDLGMNAAILINKKRVFGMARQVTSTSITNSLECVDPPDCDYIFHNTSTDTVYQDYVTNDSTSATILAGGNAYFTIGATSNEYSTIAAGGNLDLIGSTLSNQGAELYQQTDTLLTKVLIHWGDRYHGTWTYPSSSSVLMNTVPAVISAGGALTGTFTGNIDNVSIRQHTALTETGSDTQLNVYTADNVTQSPAGTGAVTLPNNSLFHTNPNPITGYYVETDPQFANYRNWLGSDYMLSALNYDPATQTKRLGDGFYEQKLIREQINQLTGRRFLVGYTDDEAQYQALMTNGVTFAQAHQLVPGIALTDVQIAQLTSDIVWLVQKTITLADGSTAQALVPQIYVRLQAGDLNSNGALLTGNNINLKLDGDLNNHSTIAGRHVVSLNADNLNNIGGRIQAGDTLSLNAQHDLNVIGTTSDVSMRQSTNLSTSTAQQTTVNRVAGLYLSNPNGILVASAGSDINLNTAEIINSGSNGTTLIDAGNNLNLGTLTETTDTYGQGASGGRKGWRRENTTQEIGTVIQTDGDLTLNAGNYLIARAATVTSTNGALNAVAGNDLTIEAGQVTYDMEAYRKGKSSGMLSSKSSVHQDTANSTDVIGSTFSGDSVDVNAGNNFNIEGSNVVGTSNVNLNAGNNITIESAQATHDETHYKKTKKTGFSPSGGASIGYGTSKLQTTNDSQQVTNVGSTVGSVEGDVTINAGLNSNKGTYTQTGSDVLTPQGNINITAQQVNIINATDTYANQQSMKYKQTGITLAITSPVISAIQTVNQMSKAANNTSDGRMKALATGNAALAANNAKDAIIAGNTPQLDENGLQVLDANGNNTAENPANQVGGINVSLSIGTSKSSSTTTQTNSSAKSSILNAGGNVTVTAVRPELVEGQTSEASNINVIGSTIKAANDVTLKADDQINLLAAQNVDTLNSKNKGSSASLGVSFGTDGFLVTAGLSGSKGKTKGNGSTWTETQIQGGNQDGDKVTLESGKDITLKGAQVTGNQVIANVGTSGQGNLNIQSLQDTNQYKDKQQSIGGSVSVGYGKMGGSFNYSDSKTKSNYQSVNEQSGILAGDGGFQVNVNGNTDLKGAVIASTDKAIQDNKNSLTTETLTTSNIQNASEYEASGSSMGVSLSYNPAQSITRNIGSNLVNLPSTLAPDLNQDGSNESVTTSAISLGQVTIKDDTEQIALTGQNAVTTVALLNRDVASANPAALTRPDIEAIKQEQAANTAIVSAATVQVTQAVNNFYTQRVLEYDQRYNETINQAQDIEAQAASYNAAGDINAADLLNRQAQSLRAQAVDMRNERDAPALSQGLAQALGTALIGGLAGQVNAGQIATSYSVGSLGNAFLLTAHRRDSDVTQGFVVTCNATPAACAEQAASLDNQINNANTSLEERIGLLEGLQATNERDEPVPAFTITIVDNNAAGNTNIAINGILNEPDRAIVLGIGHLRDNAPGQSLYLSYNDTQGVVPDLLNAFIDQSSGTSSNPSLAAAQAIIAAGGQANTNLYAHSGGTLVSNIALNSLASGGYANQNLRVDYFGPASTLSAQAAAVLNAAGLSNAPIEQQQNWLRYGNVNGQTLDNEIKPELFYGTGYRNNPNDPVPTFIGFNFGQSTQYNNPQSPSYLQGAVQGNVIQSVLEVYDLFTTSNSAHSTYRWNDPKTWPTQAIAPNAASTQPNSQASAGSQP